MHRLTASLAALGIIACTGNATIEHSSPDSVGSIEGAISTGSRVHLRANDGQYVVAELGGGGAVHANRPAAGPWETFTVDSRPEGILLRTDDGAHYLQAELGGGGAVSA